jgi:hypothetical protein
MVLSCRARLLPLCPHDDNRRTLPAAKAPLTLDVSWRACCERIKAASVRIIATLAALAVFSAHYALALQAAVTAFIDVQVVPMDREQVLAHQTVLVRGNTITVRCSRSSGGSMPCWPSREPAQPGVAVRHGIAARDVMLYGFSFDPTREGE